jgi:hypothetical protein
MVQSTEVRPDSSDAHVTTSVPVNSLRTTVRGILSIVAPSSLVIGLLYYFGWARTSYEAHALGLDDSLLGYSTQDYVLRSISSMYWPMFYGTMALLVGLGAHGFIDSWLGEHTGRPRVRLGRRLAAGLAVVGSALLVLGVAGAAVSRPSRFVSLAGPLAVTASIVVLAYAAHVLGRYGLARGNGALSREAALLAPLSWSLVVVLLFLSLFWSVSHYANVRGGDLADEANRALPSQPSITIYSAKRLYLQSPVEETVLPDPNAAYRYRYSGLKLLFRSDHNYFLRPSDISDSRNIIIAESPNLRFESGY